MSDTSARTNPSQPGPLSGIRVLDMTRILAGPTCAQLFGDLGADVLKIERPGHGDDTRKWGPPFLKDTDGNDTTESAYYLCVNRNKRLVAIDFGRPEGVALIKRLLRDCDVLVHNLKVGGLEKYGLGYEDLREEFPGLVYCAITGFGQTGPYAPRAGYDALAQAVGGLMSLTGAPEGEPMKVGVGIADIMCGMYASTAILAALRHRDATGQGQMIDLALLDTQVAWLANEALNFFLSDEIPIRRGNQHPNIVPYQVFPTADGHFFLAAGNDGQFQRFCACAGVPALAEDPRFVTNSDRLRNRAALLPLLEQETVKKSTAAWVSELESRGVPASPVHNMRQTFDDPQVQHREMSITMPYDGAEEGTVRLLGNPIKMSATPPTYRRPPPRLGEHTDEVLSQLLDMDAEERDTLRAQGLIG